MDKRAFLKCATALAAIPQFFEGEATAAPKPSKRDEGWALNVDVMESCSCPVFCQCFFTGKPPAAEGMDGMQMPHFCRFNQAYQVRRGHVGQLRLDGARFWFSGDAGDDFGKQKLEWAKLTFDTAVTPAQREVLLGVLRHLRWYRPERWKSYEIGEDSPIEWHADRHSASASLGGGRLAELKLEAMIGLQDRPVVIQNLEYFGYPRNSGFTLMPSKLLAFRGDPRAFEYDAKDTSGLVTNVDIAAGDFRDPKRAD